MESPNEEGTRSPETGPSRSPALEMGNGLAIFSLVFLVFWIAQGFGILIKGPITLISVLGGLGIMLLELFVAFMQAFVFMFLTTVFIALMDHHDHEHGHDHEHAHAHGHEHAH